MSDMAQTILGIPFTSDLPVSLNQISEQELKDQKEELERLGVSVTGIHVVEPMSPTRFFIRFKPGVPSFQTRTSLEKEGWDVGQQMGDKMLKFYATKRAVKGAGWTD